ncbi:MAG: hypothetical protein HN560_12590 [Anaerolineae bacterium]|jgi:hypothetical protein|nr:hypothetical protein [Anaerolineae bacterium]MBT6813909.1 hypothetical protein [Anaerolineae bacterium]MBT7601899.1 hypothetical protein [Anaerolineae bacterium]
MTNEEFIRLYNKKVLDDMRKKSAKSAFLRAAAFIVLMYAINLITGISRPLWIWLLGFSVLSFVYYTKSMRLAKKKREVPTASFITAERHTAMLQTSRPAHKKRDPKPCQKCRSLPVQLLFDNEVYCPHCNRHIVDKSLPAAIVAWNTAN